MIAMDVKKVFFILFVIINTCATAQIKVLHYDSIIVDYNDYLNNIYYKYLFSDEHININGEVVSHKRIVEDSAQWRFSYYADVSKEDRLIVPGKADIDSMQTLFEEMCSLVSASNGQYVDAEVEGDNLIVILTSHNQSGKRTLELVLCPDCTHVPMVNKVLDFLKTVREKPDTERALHKSN